MDSRLRGNDNHSLCLCASVVTYTHFRMYGALTEIGRAHV
jgi:hypothetical protein